MANSGERKNEIGTLRARFATLTAANLRMSESLDLETVLKEVVGGCPGAHRSALRGDYHRRRGRTSAGLRHLGLHRGRAPAPR